MGDTRGTNWFHAVFDEHYWKVRAYALRRTGQSTDADDVVAEVFLVAWRRRPDVPAPPSETLSWLLAVARGILANQRRAGNRRARLHARIATADPPTYAPDAGTGAVEVTVVREALARLRPLDREVLMLVVWDDLSRTEAAAVLDISENAVNLRLFKARKALADLLSRHDDARRQRPGGGRDDRS